MTWMHPIHQLQAMQNPLGKLERNTRQDLRTNRDAVIQLQIMNKSLNLSGDFAC